LSRKIVVTGMGIITAHGAGIKTNWDNTIKGKSSISKITSFNTSKYIGKCGGEIKGFIRAELKNLSNKRIDRASHLLIKATQEAFEEAKIDESIKKQNVFLSIGTTLGGMLSGEKFHKQVVEKGIKRAKVSYVFDYLAHYQAINLLKEFQISGDFDVLTNACASGTNSIGNAFNYLRYGLFDIAICGGYDSLSELSYAGFNSLMALTPNISRPFDQNRDGLLLGEGAGILILEELEHAINRKAPILCEIVGYGESSDAYHMTSPEPSGNSAARAIINAWKQAETPEIDYINAHGTGTKYNDIMEANAIKKAFGNNGRKIPISSIKPMVGHLLGAAGSVEAIISILSIIYKKLPPNLNYEEPDPECDLNVITKSISSNIKTVLSNSFGFGGTNATLILSEYPR